MASKTNTYADALKTVRRLHSDTSRLLKKCDRVIGKGRASLLGNAATMDLSYRVDASQWMAQGVFRFYDDPCEPGLVRGVTVCFMDSEKPGLFDQPILLVGQIQYDVPKGGSVREVLHAWDLYCGFSKWSRQRNVGKVLVPKVPRKRPIRWMKLVAVPLISVNGVRCVQVLMNRASHNDKPKRKEKP